MTEFNFFKVLEKDNKELVHSAFIAYLIDSDKQFAKEFLNISDKDLELSRLETSYIENNRNKLKKLRIRIDIEVRSRDGATVTFIENKFKSFPTKRQLDDYNRVFKSHFDKVIKINKILFCFDKRIVNFPTDWQIYDYADILSYLKKNYHLDGQDDKSIFIRHYFRFLEDYFTRYSKLDQTCHQLFHLGVTIEEKFWIRLLNSKIAMQFEQEFCDREFYMVINPGNTAVPLLNIIPLDWKTKMGEETLIQFQGNDLKFYLHSDNKKAAEKIILHAGPKRWNERLELKTISKRQEKSCYIFKMKVVENLRKEFTYTELYEIIKEFYIQTNKLIVESYVL